MGMIPRETIEEVLAATDIVDLIGAYIPLKRAGTGFKANCPFHNEKTPSFSVNPSRQFYHCFGCGKSGNAISFVMEQEGLVFMDALQKLAGKAGIVLEATPDDPRAKAARRTRGRLLDLHREAAEFFHEQLLKNADCEHGRAYLKGRGFGKGMAERWEIGWMPDQAKVFLDWARERGFRGQELVAGGFAGLKDEKRAEAGIYVRFRDRLMFPIRNEVGDVIAFSGRQLRDDPRSGKYVNSPETDIFRKGNVLFALDRAKKGILSAGAVLLCEGQIDAIACHEEGIDNAIAPLGTAFTAQHAKVLKRYAKRVVLCFDADQAGVKASERAFRELAPESLAVRVLGLPKGDDPDTFLKREGVDLFQEKMDAAKDFFDFKIDYLADQGTLETAEGRAEIARDCVSLLAVMGDHAARDQRINVVCSRLGMAAATLRDGIKQEIRRLGKQRGRDRSEDDAGHEELAEVRLDRTVGFLCALALDSAPAQHFLAEQFEILHEAKSWIEGVELLEKILVAGPDPGSSAAVNAFLSELGSGEQMALNAVLGGSEERAIDGLEAAESALGMLSSIMLQRRDAAVSAELKQPGISAKRMMDLLEEAKEIAGLMRTTNRYQYDDELPAETKKTAKPWTPWQGKRR